MAHILGSLCLLQRSGATTGQGPALVTGRQLCVAAVGPTACYILSMAARLALYICRPALNNMLTNSSQDGCVCRLPWYNTLKFAFILWLQLPRYQVRD